MIKVKPVSKSKHWASLSVWIVTLRVFSILHTRCAPHTASQTHAPWLLRNPAATKVFALSFFLLFFGPVNASSYRQSVVTSWFRASICRDSLFFQKSIFLTRKNKESRTTSICRLLILKSFPVLVVLRCFDWCGECLAKSNAAIATQSYHYGFRLQFAQS